MILNGRVTFSVEASPWLRLPALCAHTTTVPFPAPRHMTSIFFGADARELAEPTELLADYSNTLQSEIMHGQRVSPSSIRQRHFSGGERRRRMTTGGQACRPCVARSGTPLRACAAKCGGSGSRSTISRTSMSCMVEVSAAWSPSMAPASPCSMGGRRFICQSGGGR